MGEVASAKTGGAAVLNDKQWSKQPVDVKVEHVSKVFRTGREEVHALADVSLEISPGSFTSIVGPSGCGKSTLLSIVAGLDQPSSGQVSIDGKAITEPYTAAGIVFQRDVLCEWRTAIRNIMLQIEMRGKKRADYYPIALELMELVGLSDAKNRYPGQLSGGMRQRVSLCRALVHGPPLLLLDEPFGALDALTREQLNSDLSRITARNNVTSIFVTHDIGEAVAMSDRVIVMSPRPGRIVEIVDVSEIAPDRPRPSSFRATAEYISCVASIRAAFEREGVFSE